MVQEGRPGLDGFDQSRHGFSPAGLEMLMLSMLMMLLAEPIGCQTEEETPWD
jgi:hypothetical protein